MPASKSKNYRFRIIDTCLRNTSREWTLEDLIEAVSQQLASEFNVEKVSKRSIQYDIALMREQPPVGYNAPIVCIDGKYKYSDENFSLQHCQLSQPDVENLTEVVNTLKQFKDYTHLGDILKIIEKIETIIALNPLPDNPFVQFETSETLQKGIAWLRQIFDATVQKRVVELTLKQYDESITQQVVHPYFLREFCGEWYLYALSERSHTLVAVPVQQIVALSPQIVTFIENTTYTPAYFRALFGIEPSESTKIVEVKLKIDAHLAARCAEEPVHESQTLSPVNENGAVLTLNIIPTEDFMQFVLQYGVRIKVESPEKLRKTIIQELKTAYDAYFQLSLF
ncbi:MAG: WYL domain-containing protein [Bacteroidales bacterium]|jgi:predicted DNA-binding transcriptional regulator YafY|nr:WYL domain-containing protein [Bacteroidales bacterium]